MGAASRRNRSYIRKKVRAKRSDPVLRSKITWWFGKSSDSPSQRSSPKTPADHLQPAPTSPSPAPTISHEESTPAVPKKRSRGRKQGKKLAATPTTLATPEAFPGSRRILDGCSPVLQARNASLFPKNPKEDPLLLPSGMKKKGCPSKDVRKVTTSSESLAPNRKRKQDNVSTTEEAKKESSTLHNEAEEEGS